MEHQRKHESCKFLRIMKRKKTIHVRSEIPNRVTIAPMVEGLARMKTSVMFHLSPFPPYLDTKEEGKNFSYFRLVHFFSSNIFFFFSTKE